MNIPQYLQSHPAMKWVGFSCFALLLGFGSAIALLFLGMGEVWPQRFATMTGSLIAAIIWRVAVGGFPWSPPPSTR